LNSILLEPEYCALDKTAPWTTLRLGQHCLLNSILLGPEYCALDNTVPQTTLLFEEYCFWEQSTTTKYTNS